MKNKVFFVLTLIFIIIPLNAEEISKPRTWNLDRFKAKVFDYDTNRSGDIKVSYLQLLISMQIGVVLVKSCSDNGRTC